MDICLVDGPKCRMLISGRLLLLVEEQLRRSSLRTPAARTATLAFANPGPAGVVVLNAVEEAEFRSATVAVTRRRIRACSATS